MLWRISRVIIALFLAIPFQIWGLFFGVEPVYATSLNADVLVTYQMGVSPPTVTNGIGASGIAETTARLNGEVTSTGNENPAVIVFYGTSDGGTAPASWSDNVNLGIKTLGAFYYDASGLLPTTLYYYRMYAENTAGGSWALSTANFTTTAYVIPATGEKPLPRTVAKTNTLTGITLILILAIFCVLGFWRPNSIIYMILTAISLPLGLSAPDILSSESITTPVDIAFGIMLIIFAFLCAEWALRLMFWRGDER